MPHRLIHKLNTLMSAEFAAPPSPHLVLGERECANLPDPVLDILDDIFVAARSVFGFDTPTAGQLHMMEKAGFPVQWERGIICTAKGSVRYKE